MSEVYRRIARYLPICSIARESSTRLSINSTSLTTPGLKKPFSSDQSTISFICGALRRFAIRGSENATGMRNQGKLRYSIWDNCIFSTKVGWFLTQGRLLLTATDNLKKIKRDSRRFSTRSKRSWAELIHELIEYDYELGHLWKNIYFLDRLLKLWWRISWAFNVSELLIWSRCFPSVFQID